MTASHDDATKLVPILPPKPEPPPPHGKMTILWHTGDIHQTAMPRWLANDILRKMELGRPFAWELPGQFGVINPAHVCDATFVQDEVKP